LFKILGGFHTFALSVSGSVYGWGKNTCGQLGVGNTEDKYQPNQLATLRSLGVCYITAGSEHSAFLTQVCLFIHNNGLD
jgi:E3 ubiquitin-protein ligase HERC4